MENKTQIHLNIDLRGKCHTVVTGVRVVLMSGGFWLGGSKSGEHKECLRNHPVLHLIQGAKRTLDYIWNKMFVFEGSISRLVLFVRIADICFMLLFH